MTAKLSPAVLLALFVCCHPPMETASCTAPFGGPDALRGLQALDSVANVTVWDDYRLGRHALLLVADSTYRGAPATPVCAAIWRADSPLEIIPLTARPQLSTPLYGMINLDSIGPGALESSNALATMLRQTHPGTAAALRARGIARAVVLPFPMNLARLGALGTALKQAGVDPVMVQADLAVHESFHLHVQFPAWLDQTREYAWPGWDSQPNRQELRERCYGGSAEVDAAVRAEHEALLAAFDALDSAITPSGRADVLGHARKFVDLRNARYALLDSMSVASEGRAVSCATAEDLMELEEGTAQWIGHATTVRAGLTTRAAKRGSYAQLQAEAFYQFGPLQLWVLEAITGTEEMRRFTTALARSSRPEGAGGGLFARFDFSTGLLASPRSSRP